MIKMSQYGDLVKLPSYLKPPEILPDETPDLPDAQENNEALDEFDEQGENEADEVLLQDSKDSRGVIGDAFDKAKEIIDAAEAYKANAIREATEKMNEECSKLKVKSREEGLALGKLEGKKIGEEEGYKSGYNDGLEKAEEENRFIVAELERMISDVQDAKKFIAQKYEDDLQNLAVAIAKKIVNAELEVNGDVISNIIKGAVSDYYNQEWVTITVSEKTADKIEQIDKSIIRELKRVSGNVKIIASPQAEDGDCFIELPEVAIDASVDAQLLSIADAIG